MTEHNFEATVETDHGTFAFSGDDPETVSAQAARMRVLLHKKQVEHRIDMDTSITKYLERIARAEKRNEPGDETQSVDREGDQDV